MASPANTPNLPASDDDAFDVIDLAYRDPVIALVRQLKTLNDDHRSTIEDAVARAGGDREKAISELVAWQQLGAAFLVISDLIEAAERQHGSVSRRVFELRLARSDLINDFTHDRQNSRSMCAHHDFLQKTKEVFGECSPEYVEVELRTPLLEYTQEEITERQGMIWGRVVRTGKQCSAIAAEIILLLTSIPKNVLFAHALEVELDACKAREGRSPSFLQARLLGKSAELLMLSRTTVNEKTASEQLAEAIKIIEVIQSERNLRREEKLSYLGILEQALDWGVKTSSAGSADFLSRRCALADDLYSLHDPKRAEVYVKAGDRYMQLSNWEAALTAYKMGRVNKEVAALREVKEWPPFVCGMAIQAAIGCGKAHAKHQESQDNDIEDAWQEALTIAHVRTHEKMSIEHYVTALADFLATDGRHEAKLKIFVQMCEMMSTNLFAWMKAVEIGGENTFAQLGKNVDFSLQPAFFKAVCRFREIDRKYKNEFRGE
jgi:hypothetical protein